MRPQIVTLGPLVALEIYSDTPGGTGTNLLTESVVSNFAQQIVVSITTANILTITGLDVDGVEVVEIVSSSATTSNYFKEVTSIVNTETNALVLTFDTTAAVTESIPVTWRQTPFNMACSAIELAGSGTAEMQSTPEEKTIDESFSNDATWFPIPFVVDGVSSNDTTASAQTNLSWPQQAVRGTIIAGGSTASWKFIFTQGSNL